MQFQGFSMKICMSGKSSSSTPSEVESMLPSEIGNSNLLQMYFSSWRGLLIYIIAWSFSKKTYLYNFEDNYVTINARMFVCLTKYYSQSWWCLCMFVTTLVLVLLYLINQNILLCNLWWKCLTEDFVGDLWNLQCISCL